MKVVRGDCGERHHAGSTIFVMSTDEADRLESSESTDNHSILMQPPLSP